MKNPLIAVLLAASTLLPGAAMAQLHEGDMEMSVVASQLTLSGNDAWHANGLAIFEGDFGDLSGGPYATDDPGYDSEDGTFAAGAIINYAALGSLSYWNGTQWLASVPGSEYVRLTGNFGEESRWTVAGTTGDLSGLIGQAGADGKIHEHLDMAVARVGGGAPAVGAYLIQLQLTSSSYLSSVPYYIALNRGLSEEDFETAIGALGPVPEAQTWLMMAAGLGLVGLRLRRRVEAQRA